MIECFNLQIQRKGSDLTAPKKFKFLKFTLALINNS